MDKYSVLKQYFGHRGFREGQEQLVDRHAGSGRDVLGVMPTGGGQVGVLPGPRPAAARG